MKVTVCELNNDPAGLERDWARLVDHVRREASQLVLLPEMPFYPWFARTRDFEPRVWDAAVAAHAAWLERLPELAPAAVLGARPVTNADRRRLNEAFVWDPLYGYRGVHAKYYLPDDEGFWEASWYQRGPGDFSPFQVAGLQAGFQVCTELWFMQRARRYGQEGVHLLAVPRATEYGTRLKWLVGGRAAAVISGAYCLSSCPVTPVDSPLALAGQGWIIDPDGEVLGLTSPEQPFLTIDIDPARAERAKLTYPRDVQD
jgi:N-carbamoylputrescine amidase